MRYFKLTDSTGTIVEYIEVSDDMHEIHTASDSTTVEEISEIEYEQIINPNRSKLDMFMPIVDRATR